MHLSKLSKKTDKAKLKFQDKISLSSSPKRFNSNSITTQSSIKNSQNKIDDK